MATTVGPPATASIGGSSSPPLHGGAAKDRKKSAHWTDQDTEVLIGVLLTHRESGRTADNGFKPSVWEEAAGLLERTVYMGGMKTPDACKSRWQRLQRDFKYATQLESLPGFSWDRSQHRLRASEEAWDAAEFKVPDAKKHKKIHLPHYDSLSILCPTDTIRARPRLPKPRVSSASLSDGSVMSMGMTPANPQHANGATMVGQLVGDGGVHHHPHPSHGSMQQPGMPGRPLMWPQDTRPGGEDGVDTSFTMPDGSRPQMTVHQKRLSHYEPNLLSATGNPQATGLPSPKRQRTENGSRPTGFPTTPQAPGRPTPTPPQPPPQQLYQFPIDSQGRQLPGPPPHPLQSPQQLSQAQPHPHSSAPPGQPNAATHPHHAYAPPPHNPIHASPIHASPSPLLNQHQTQLPPFHRSPQFTQSLGDPSLPSPSIYQHPMLPDTSPHNFAGVPNGQETQPGHVRGQSMGAKHVRGASGGNEQQNPVRPPIQPTRSASGSDERVRLNGFSSHPRPMPTAAHGHSRAMSSSNARANGAMAGPPDQSPAEGMGLPGPNALGVGVGMPAMPVVSPVAISSTSAGNVMPQSSNGAIPTTVTSLTTANANTGPGPSSSASTPVSSRAPEVIQAGLSEAQRRTEAILRLQDQQEQHGLDDDEVLTVLQEFEEKITTVDSYLAINRNKDQLRLGYLLRVVLRRGGIVRSATLQTVQKQLKQ